MTGSPTRPSAAAAPAARAGVLAQAAAQQGRARRAASSSLLFAAARDRGAACSRPAIRSKTSWPRSASRHRPLHWFGTDELGRDVLSRMIWGARASLMAGVISVAIAVRDRRAVRPVAGYFGGWIDAVISRVTEAFWPARS